MLLTGPRQVGKTTLLKECASEERNYVTLDDLEQRATAQNDPALFLQSHPRYLQTYIERDVRALTRVGDEITFQRFLPAPAARTGQLINYADLSRDVDIDQKTAKAWLSILGASMETAMRPLERIVKRL